MSPRSWSEYEAALLLGGTWLPVTGCVLFVRATPEQCADTMVHGVRGSRVLALFGYPLRKRRVDADSLPGLLENLVPLDSNEDRRLLFLSTSNPAWTAMFGSNWRGLDPHSAMSWFAVAGIETVAIKDSPNSYDRKTDRGFYGSRKIETYELIPGQEPVGHSLGVRVSEPPRWDFVQPSGQFPVGNVYDPGAWRVPNRFTHEHLAEMALRYGLRPFDDDFYAPDGRGFIVERTDPPQPDAYVATLAQARGDAPAPASPY